MIVLLAATPLETSYWRPVLTPDSPQAGGFASFRGRAHGQELALILSGVGKANAAAAAALALAKHSPELVVNFGCAGAFPATGLKLGDLVLASVEIFGDEGVAAPDGFLDLEALNLPLLQEGEDLFFNQFSLSTALYDTARGAIAQTARQLQRDWREGPVVTVSRGSGNQGDSERLWQRTGALCENMEGAAIALTCRRFGVPLVEMRGISNWTGDRDPSAWDLPAACAAAEQACDTFIKNISFRELAP